MSVKPFRTINEQIDILISRNLKITNIRFAENVLNAINYYRFTGYLFPFKKSESIDGEIYINNTTFEKIYDIYEFDRKLRSVLFLAIEPVEIFLRSKIAHFHSKKYGPLGYLEKENYREGFKYISFQEEIKKEIDRNKKLIFVKHHIEKYESKFPLWAAIELFSFGDLYTLISGMALDDRREFSNDTYKASYREIESFIKCVKTLRNICAHHGRLYNLNFLDLPCDSNTFNIKRNRDFHHRLFGPLLALRAIYPDKDKWTSEVALPIADLISEYREYIDLKHIDFPENWKERIS